MDVVIICKNFGYTHCLTHYVLRVLYISQNAQRLYNKELMGFL